MPAPPAPRAWPGSPVPRWRWCPRARTGPARAPARSHKPSGQSTAQRSSSPPPPRRPPSVSPDSKGDRQSSWRWCSHASPAAAAIFAVLSPNGFNSQIPFPNLVPKMDFRSSWGTAVRGQESSPLHSETDRGTPPVPGMSPGMFCTSTGHGHRFTVHRVVCHGGE